MRKTSLEPQQNCSMQQSTPKNALYWKNNKRSKVGKICHNAWAIAFAKASIWVKNQNVEKHAKNVSRATTELFYAKIHSKKGLIFEK